MPTSVSRQNSARAIMRSIFAAAVLIAGASLATPSMALSFGSGSFSERLYDGCATKAELFATVRTYGAKPKRITSVKPGYVLIRGKDKDGLTYDFYVVPCRLALDGRFLIEH